MSDLRLEPTSDFPESLRIAVARWTAERLKVDPKDRDPLAQIFGPLVTGTATDHERDLAGKLLAQLVESGSVERLTEVFASIRRMKKQLDEPGQHRNRIVFSAYVDFTVITGREPKKVELKDFILERPKQYVHGWPDRDSSEWTRIWKESGLYS